MAKLGRGTDVFSILLEKEKRAYIKTRADTIDWSGSKFGSAIIEWWLNQGAPKVHPLDRVIPVPEFAPRVRYLRLPKPHQKGV